MFNDIDWRSIFLPDVSVVEIVLRGSLMYLAIFVLLRLVLKRQIGTLGTTDLLLITLLADASQNAMAGEYKSVPDGFVLVGTKVPFKLTLRFTYLSNTCQCTPSQRRLQWPFRSRSRNP